MFNPVHNSAPLMHKTIQSWLHRQLCCTE